MHTQSNFVQQCIQISTRINILQCTYVHPSFVLHCMYLTTFSNGLLTNNSTHYRMARTQGGRIARPVAPPKVYMMPNGVKVRRMDGGFRYQPPFLKTLSSIQLDKMRKNPTPNLLLYQSIQKVLDKLVGMVEDKILGFDVTGIAKY